MGSTIEGQVATANVTHPIVLLIPEESEAKSKLIMQWIRGESTNLDRALNVSQRQCHCEPLQCNVDSKQS